MFIGPPKKREKFTLVLLKIEKTVFGLPRMCTILNDNEKILIEGGEHFITAYIPACVAEPDDEVPDQTQG